MCPIQVGEKPLELVDARIDLSGEVMIAKEADSTETTPIILQWMLMACDPDSVSRETCDDLPVLYFITVNYLINFQILQKETENVSILL